MKKTEINAGKFFTRFLAGDESMVDELRANAVSDNPLNRLARNEIEHYTINPSVSEMPKHVPDPLKSIKYWKNMENRWYFCVRDVIMVVCEVSNVRSSQIMIESRFRENINLEFRAYQWPGARQSRQPVATFDDIQKLIMQLPGQKAK